MFNKNLLGVGLNNCTIRFYTLGKYEGIFIKEIKDIHIKGINKFICSKNYNSFLTSGEEGLIKILLHFNQCQLHHNYEYQTNKNMLYLIKFHLYYMLHLIYSLIQHMIFYFYQYHLIFYDVMQHL